MIVAAFLMCDGSEFETRKGQNERRHDHLSSCTYIVEVLGDGCQHWNEDVEQENRDEGYQRDKRKQRTETEAGNFVRDTNLEPVEPSEYWRGMYIRGCTNYKTTCTVWYPLKFRDR